MCVCIFLRWKWSCRHVFYKEKISFSTIRAIILLILTRYKATFIIKFCRIFQCFRKRGFEPRWQAGPAKTITEPATSRALPHTQVLNGPSAQVSVTPTVQRQTEVTAHFSSEQLLLFAFAQQSWLYYAAQRERRGAIVIAWCFAIAATSFSCFEYASVQAGIMWTSHQPGPEFPYKLRYIIGGHLDQSEAYHIS